MVGSKLQGLILKVWSAFASPEQGATHPEPKRRVYALPSERMASSYHFEFRAAQHPDD